MNTCIITNVLFIPGLRVWVWLFPIEAVNQIWGYLWKVKFWNKKIWIKWVQTMSPNMPAHFKLWANLSFICDMRPKYTVVLQTHTNTTLTTDFVCGSDGQMTYKWSKFINTPVTAHCLGGFHRLANVKTTSKIKPFYFCVCFVVMLSAGRNRNMLMCYCKKKSNHKMSDAHNRNTCCFLQWCKNVDDKENWKELFKGVILGPNIISIN